MNRRGFLTLLGRGAACAWIAPFLPDVLSTDLPITVLPPTLGVSARFIQQFEVGHRPIKRYDVLFGFANQTPMPPGWDVSLAVKHFADTIDRRAAEAAYGVIVGE